jgi:hypothetical protein
MTNVNILRSLILLSFFVFSLPFFQMCSTLHSEESPEEYIGEQKINEKKENIIENGIATDSSENTSIQNIEEGQKDGSNEPNYFCTFCIDGELSAYFLSLVLLEDIYNLKLKPENFSFYMLTVVILNTFIMLILSFRTNKFKIIYKMSLFNIFLLLLFFVFMLYDIKFKNINQILYGFYLIVLNQVLIFLFSFKLINNKLKTNYN